MPLLKDGELERIDLPVDGEWVEVKPRPSRGDEIWVQAQVARHLQSLNKGSGPDAALAVTGDMGEALAAAEFAMLERAIKRWSFADELTPENIRLLDPASVACLKERIGEMWAPRTEEARRDLSGSSPAPSTEKGRGQGS